MFSIFQALQRSGDASATGNEVLTLLSMHRHHRSAAQQTAHFHPVAYHLAGGRDYAHGGGLGIDHADGRLVSDDGRDGSGGGTGVGGYFLLKKRKLF